MSQTNETPNTGLTTSQIQLLTTLESLESKSVSKRCENLIKTNDVEFAKKYSAYQALLDPFDSTTNPNGIINMGTAVSGLMDDILLERFSVDREEYFNLTQQNFRYYSFYGSVEFRQNIANFLTRFFKPSAPRFVSYDESIKYENIFVLNGALVSMDILLSFLTDENEVVLVPTPAYSSYFHSGVERWNVKMCPIPMQHNQETGELFELNIQLIEKIYEEQCKKGNKVKAFILNNPHNPLGKVFSKELVLSIMEFCAKNGLHLISDEMYCLSVFDSTAKFHSVLELEKESTLDKNYLHVIWGFSKDLCLTSFRTGFIHTCNEKLKLALILQSQFQAPSLATMNTLSKFISNLDWLETQFVPTHREKLRNAYMKTKECFDSIGITTTCTVAGFFLLANLRPILLPPNKENCGALVTHFYKHKVYLTPYWDMRMEEEGWFRIVFTVTPDALELGLTRIKNAIAEWNEINK